MKKLLLTLLTIITLSGCAAWWQQLKNDPVTAIESDISYVRSAEALATGAFDIWAGANPVQGTASRAQFTIIMVRIDQALVTVQDALRVAADARQAPPNPDAVMRDVQAALTDLFNFVSGLTGNSIGHAASPEMQQAITALDHARHLH